MIKVKGKNIKINFYIFSVRSNLEEKYDPENGFLLSAELHILFDSTDNKLKIDPVTQIISFCKEILENKTMAEYKKYHNKKIELSDKQKYYLKKKYFG